MKIEHRAKAISAYQGAKVVAKQGMVYPTYVLTKEAVRASLAYISEEVNNRDYSEKTKLKALLTDMPAVLSNDIDVTVFNIILELEEEGLGAILCTDVADLKPALKAVKKLISIYMGESL